MSKHQTPNTHSKKMNTSFFWNSGGNLTNTIGSTDYLCSNGISSAQLENITKIVIPYDGVLSDFTVALVGSTSSDASPGASNSRTFTIRKNGVDTNLTITVTGSAVNGSNAHSLDVKKFDLISLKHTVTGPITKNAVGIAGISLSGY